MKPVKLSWCVYDAKPWYDNWQWRSLSPSVAAPDSWLATVEATRPDAAPQVVELGLVLDDRNRPRVCMARFATYSGHGLTPLDLRIPLATLARAALAAVTHRYVGGQIATRFPTAFCARRLHGILAAPPPKRQPQRAITEAELDVVDRALESAPYRLRRAAVTEALREATGRSYSYGQVKRRLAKASQRRRLTGRKEAA